MSQLPSERVIIESPTSFSGSAKRLWRITEKVGAAKWLVAIGVILLILIAWVLVFSWYCIWGIFLVPWRLIRRGSRKRKREDMQHREVLGAIDRQQPPTSPQP